MEYFFKQQFLFYTGRDYVEFREKFKGKLSVAVLGGAKSAAIAKLKLGKPIRTEKQEDGREALFFKTTYDYLREELAVSFNLFTVPRYKLTIILSQFCVKPCTKAKLKIDNAIIFSYLLIFSKSKGKTSL